jgi:hypothetical protein
MHKKTRWDNLGEITVKTWDFQVKTYPNIEAAVRSVQFGSYYWNDTIKYGYLRYCSSNPEYRHIGHIGDSKIFLTCEGVIIPPWKIWEVYNNLPYVEPYRASWARRSKFKFRDGPVPGIRCWKASGRGYHRHVFTQAERRETAFHEHYDEDCIEHQVKIRGKRRHMSIPNSWDDLSYSDYRKKSWKNYRSHQWKTNK